MADAWAIPSTARRSEVLAKVERMKASFELAQARERDADALCQDVARQIDELDAELKAARRAKKPTAHLEQQLASLENELSIEKADLATLQENTKDALAALREAESARGQYIEDVELAGAPARFEGMISKSNAVLTGLAGAALTTSYQVSGEQGNALSWAVWTSIAALALGLASYVPTVLAASLDALRRGGGSSGTLSYMVSWHGWIRWMQVIVLILLAGLVVTSWVFLARAFFGGT